MLVKDGYINIMKSICEGIIKNLFDKSSPSLVPWALILNVPTFNQPFS